MITCPQCEPGCNCCDFCRHYDFNADEEGRYVDKGYCRFHGKPMHPGGDCDDFHCEFTEDITE